MNSQIKSDIRLLKINQEKMFSQISWLPIVKDKAVDVLSYDEILQNVIERKIDGWPHNLNELIGILRIYVCRPGIYLSGHFFWLVLDMHIINKCVPLEFQIGLADVHEITKYF